jgi:hypothetical protein
VKSAALLFKWPHRHRIHLLLPTMLVLAALAHGGIFFLFSVANPPVKADGLNPARVYFLDEGSPELAQLETILASNDPALFAPRHPSSANRESTAIYVPQYASAKTALLNMPPRIKTDAVTSPNPNPVLVRKPQPTPATTAVHTDSNRLSASPELASRLPETRNEMSFPQATTAEALDSASFFVGVRSDGTVAHITPSRSSGDTKLDQQTLQILQSLRFAPDKNIPLAWGFVSFHFAVSKSHSVEP